MQIVTSQWQWELLSESKPEVDMASHVLVGVVGGVGHERSPNRRLIGEHSREDAFEGVGGAVIPACINARGEE